MADTAGENTYYLAYPDDAVLFQYRTVRGGIILTPETVTGTFILNGVDYRVLRFRNLSSGTNIDVESL